MTTTKALAKLYKTVTGKEPKNSMGRILSDLADAWGTSVNSANTAKIPTLPTLSSNGTKYYVLKVVKSSSGTTYTWDEKTFT